jgi:hypothetical protein
VRTGHRNDALPRIEASRERTPGNISSMRKGGLAEAATSPLQVYWSDFIRWSGAPARRGCRAPPSTRCRRSIKLYASGGRDGVLHVLATPPAERPGSGLEPFAARSIQVQAPCGRAGAAGASGRPALGTISAESSDDVDAVDGNHVFAVFLVDRRHEFKAHARRTYASVPPSLGDYVRLTQLSGVRQTVTNESLHKVAHKNNSSSGREGRSCSIRRPVTLA